ncbi:MAG: ABC transporter permease [Huintestinicola sp.]|uniref:ABC transporter permease n=1 Tax=Huintestinicola sp. TaxID=2981661 RepID=UPI003F0FE6CF
MSIINKIINTLKSNRFLLEELIKRDFKKKYKRTVLGMLWSLLSPLFMLTVMAVVFTNFFGRNINHFVTYLFCGNLVFTYFSDSTTQGMHSLYANASIFSKINVPKYLFLLSKNAASLINFLLTLVIFFIFVLCDGIAFTPKFLLLAVPIVCLVIFNLGVGMILSALFIMFRDVQYLYDIFKTALMYFSAIFYSIDTFSETMQKLFFCNPVYVYIYYFREIVLYNTIPSAGINCLCAFYALAAISIGCVVYRKLNYKFLYYV